MFLDHYNNNNNHRIYEYKGKNMCRVRVGVFGKNKNINHISLMRFIITYCVNEIIRVYIDIFDEIHYYLLCE